jgi:hypothetical protein
MDVWVQDPNWELVRIPISPPVPSRLVKKRPRPYSTTREVSSSFRVFVRVSIFVSKFGGQSPATLPTKYVRACNFDLFGFPLAFKCKLAFVGIWYLVSGIKSSKSGEILVRSHDGMIFVSA